MLQNRETRVLHVHGLFATLSTQSVLPPNLLCPHLNIHLHVKVLRDAGQVSSTPDISTILHVTHKGENGSKS